MRLYCIQLPIYICHNVFVNQSYCRKMKNEKWTMLFQMFSIVHYSLENKRYGTKYMNQFALIPKSIDSPIIDDRVIKVKLIGLTVSPLDVYILDLGK